MLNSAAAGVALTACAALALSLFSGCSKAITYSYVDVHVTIDQTTVTATKLYLITSCQAQVIAADGSTDTVSLRCRENHVNYDVGTFEWTTSKAGPIQFNLQVLDANLVTIASKVSDPITPAPGKHVATEITLVGVSASGGADSGVDGTPPLTDASGGDAGTDAIAPADVAADTATDGPTDASASGDAAAADHPADTVPDGGVTDAAADQSAATDVAPSDLAGDQSATDGGATDQGGADSAALDAGLSTDGG